MEFDVLAFSDPNNAVFQMLWLVLNVPSFDISPFGSHGSLIVCAPLDTRVIDSKTGMRKIDRIGCVILKMLFSMVLSCSL